MFSAKTEHGFVSFLSIDDCEEFISMYKKGLCPLVNTGVVYNHNDWMALKEGAKVNKKLSEVEKGLMADAREPGTWTVEALNNTPLRRRKIGRKTDTRDPIALESICNAMGYNPWTDKDIIKAKYSKDSFLALIEKLIAEFFAQDDWEAKFDAVAAKKAWSTDIEDYEVNGEVTDDEIDADEPKIRHLRYPVPLDKDGNIRTEPVEDYSPYLSNTNDHAESMDLNSIIKMVAQAISGKTARVTISIEGDDISLTAKFGG